MARSSSLNTELLSSVANEMMSGKNHVEVQGNSMYVRCTSSHKLKTVAFTMNGREYAAIQQNPDKPSRWGQLAKAGHQVVQFKDAETNRFVAVAVDGRVKEYGALKKRKTSERD